MDDEATAAPDGTAVRVALWRAMHIHVDPPPHVLADEIGLVLAAPDEGWRRRPDMDPHFTCLFLRLHRSPCSPHRGSGCGTCRPRRGAVRHPRRRARHLRVAPAGDCRQAAGIRGRQAGSPGLEASATDRARLRHPEWLRLVPVDFEAGGSWWEGLEAAGFAAGPIGGRGLHRRQHLSHKGGGRGRDAPGCGARPGLDAGHGIHPAARICRPGGASRVRGSGERGASKRDALHQLSLHRHRCLPWPARLVSDKCSTCRQPLLPSATLLVGRSACGREARRRCR